MHVYIREYTTAVYADCLGNFTVEIYYGSELTKVEGPAFLNVMKKRYESKPLGL